MDIKENFEKIKQNLKEDFELSNILYGTWIEPLDIFSIEENIVNIFTEEEEFVDYLTRKYKTPFKVAISEFAGKEYDVNFVSVSSIKKGDSENTTISPEEFNKYSNINYDFTFDTFVVGKNNKFAHAAAVAVADNPGMNGYNPFFIYGGVGLGKTHLMHAIANEILKNDKSKKVLYTTAEDFCNEIVGAIASGRGNFNNLNSINEIRDKYRNADLLLIDDIQFVIGKEKTQEEFFYTFNTLIGKKKQVVLTSDRSPRDLDGLDDRYISRFISGIMYEIDSPDYETRMAILLNKMKQNNLTEEVIPYEVLDYIAKNIKSNIRELEGCFNKVKAYTLLSGKKTINLNTAKEELKNNISPEKVKELTPEIVIEFVSDHFNIPVKDLKSGSRKKEISTAKHICMYISRKLTKYTLTDIANALGGMDHSSVDYGINNIKRLLKTDKELARNIDLIIKKINPDNVK